MRKTLVNLTLATLFSECGIWLLMNDTCLLVKSFPPPEYNIIQLYSLV